MNATNTLIAHRALGDSSLGLTDCYGRLCDLITHPYEIHPYFLPATSYRMFASPFHENQA